MRRGLAALFGVAILLGLPGPRCLGGTYQLVTGQNLTGEPIAPDTNGVIIKLSATIFSERIHWTNFTEAALKEMAAEDSKIKSIVAAYVLDEPEIPLEVKKRPEVRAKPVTRIAAPDPQPGWGAFVSSKLVLGLFGLLYAANLYAAYQISLFRSYNPIVVCGSAALLPVLGPVFFLCLPSSFGTPLPPEEEVMESEEEAYAQEAADAAGPAPAPAPVAAPASAKRTPPPTVYARGQFTFNRRFFETKLAGFLRVVPSEAERDMVVCIESARGRHVGTRIVRIMPNELYLQVAKSGASSEVVIPFNDIKVVTVRHKDV